MLSEKSDVNYARMSVLKIIIVQHYSETINGSKGEQTALLSRSGSRREEPRSFAHPYAGTTILEEKQKHSF